MALGDFPPGRHVGQAVIVASAAAVVGVWLSSLPDMAPAMASGMLLLYLLVGFPIALAHALLLGIPVYLVLGDRWRLRWWNAALAGLLIGALPSLFLAFVEGSLPAAAGSVAKAGIGGLAGGVSFWGMLRRSGSCR